MSNMTGVITPIDGESKKRVVRQRSEYSFILLTPGKCYFFDSDVGGFHYGPGHP